MTWLNLFLDVALILIVGAGVVQATRLIAQLRDLRTGRGEMERFVRDFNTAVIRAEAGIKALRSAARDSGDDLEKLIEKAHRVRDELHFIVESADSVAERLSVTASSALQEITQIRKGVPMREPEARKNGMPSSVGGKPAFVVEAAAASRAEKELLHVLQKLG